ncbi:3-hydroxyacyl-CoA dehydrogenase NAD-binding domain-containing protein [Kineococcus sp. LSe6-4]|uniref:enoyl-CoA hydratase n=1 Tax=Kineococcus halophytocola TaxID=3234027 RepID=A0ABV4H0S6_9ACTN
MIATTSVREVAGHRIALLELTADERRPLTWDATALESLGSAVAAVGGLDVEALVLLGPGGGLGAGADLQELRSPRQPDLGLRVAERGYAALEPLRTLPVPTVALLAGPALGGALEVGLTADVRIARDGAAVLGLPEVRLGLVPGWGGVTRLAELTGRAVAGRVAVTDALAGRTLSATGALEAGVVDVVLAGEDLDSFVEQAVTAVAAALDAPGSGQPAPPPQTPPTAAWEAWEAWDGGALLAAVERRTPGGTDAVRAAVELLDALGDVEATAGTSLRERTAVRLSRPEPPLRKETVTAFDRLVGGVQARAGIASFFAVQRARSATRRAAAGARWSRVGVVGGGLMATQLAALVAQRTGARVHLVEVDPERAATAVQRVRGHLERAVRAGLDAAAAAAAAEATTAGTDLADLAGCEAVIEAVVEDLAVKRSVWRDLEDVVDDTTLLLTNTSSLSVTAMGDGLRHPERVVGLHFFNPVAVLPLVEVVAAPATSSEAVRTTLALADALGKTAVTSADAPGFIVNRLLSRWMGDALSLVDAGEDPEVVDRALQPDGLPMTPFQLVEHIGPAVQLHILESLQDAFPDRFVASACLRELVQHDLPGFRDPSAAALLPPRSGTATSPQVRRSLLCGLADELDQVLREHVAADVQDVDAAMLLGAGFPPHQRGLSGLLDTSGASQLVRGSRFHEEGAR